MPPKKKNTDKDKGKDTAAAVTPTPGSATQPDSAEDRENELTANFSSIVDDFTSSSTVAIDAFQEILERSLEISKQKYIEKNTDLFTANAACEALTELTDWLYLKCEEPAELNDFETVFEPKKVELDAWAENATGQEDTQFGLDKTDEVIDMHKGQRGLVGTVDMTQVNLLPEWLRPESRPPTTVAGSMYSQTLMTPATRKQRPKNTQKQQKTSRSTKKPSSLIDISVSEQQIEAKPTPPPASPKAPSNSQSKTNSLSSSRLRQFKRRSVQHKVQKKINQGPNHRLEPMMQEYGVPAQFIEPSAEEKEDRRKAIKNGSVRPQTKSEMEMMKGITRSPMKNPNSKPKRIPSLRSNTELPVVSGSITRIAALPETLVDSLAISDGSSLTQYQDFGGCDDFDRLKLVSVNASS
jgi:hypothetical protein